ncbi:MAG TPA: VTT domain-containing protein [Vicinamibacterales bacterium]|nr:VTT domain-containing protein [Vicinamibacterales bacterium]
MTSPRGRFSRAWVRPVGVVLLFIAVPLTAATVAAVLRPDLGFEVTHLAAWAEPHRHAWYALPAVVFVFVALGLVLVPVLLLIAATGLAFGPWLGPIYAMAGCLASASMGFLIGRWTGLHRVERLGGENVARLLAALERNGTLAVFLFRKVPAPFMLTNVVAGAARIRYRDFLLGTLLGMTAIVIALAGFGYQLTQVLDDPSPERMALAAIAIAVPLTLAWLINRMLRQRREA